MNEIWLAHHGIEGQRWGVRRYQNKDGSLTPAGEKHVKANEDKKDYGVTEATKKKQAKDRLKTALVAGGIAAGAAALYAAYTAKKSDQAIRFISDGMLKLDMKSAAVQGAMDAGKAFVLGGATAYAAKAFYHHRRNKAISEQREKKARFIDSLPEYNPNDYKK